MSRPVSVYNNAPEHRAELIDAAENEMKWFFSSFYLVCLSEMVPRECFSLGPRVMGARWVANRRKIGSLVHVHAEAVDID